jgi:putative RNA 2'-phosphotransferase
MTPQQKNRQFSKVLLYILERHPEEFGLIPDENGYYKIKDLLRAVNETDGWRHIRESNLKELLLVEAEPQFEISENLIRGSNRAHLPTPARCEDLPKLLYTSVRKKAYPQSLEKGIFPAGHHQVICTPDLDMANRLGARKDRFAVCLTIHTSKTAEKGVTFHRFTDLFYLADHIPADTFTGPPVPKEPAKEASGPQKTPKPNESFGTFSITPEMIESVSGKPKKGKKKKVDWKQDRKHRKKDRNSWPDAL